MNIKTNKGFTFVELIIVISILFILISVIFASSGNRKKNAACVAITKEITNLIDGIMIYYNQNGTIPTNSTELFSHTNKAITTNVSGFNYNVSLAGDIVTLTTTVPSGVGSCIRNNIRYNTTVTLSGTNEIINVTFNRNLSLYKMEPHITDIYLDKQTTYRENYNYSTNTNIIF
jgi:prepilin-type N-terminal cleavage/methylation domain-containing protein